MRTLVLLLALAAAPALAQERVISDGTSTDGWTADPAIGVRLGIVEDEGAIRLDVDFGDGGGYAIARKAVRLDLPARYALRYRLRAERPDGGDVIQDLEVKLIDTAGESVWWHNRRTFRYPSEWTGLATRDRHVSFAWGPRGGGAPTDVGSIEFVVTAVEGGRVTVWLDDVTYEPLPDAPPPETALVALNPGAAADAVDGNRETGWAADGPLVVDLGARRELGGVALEWWSPPDRYTVELSDDGERWRARQTVERPHGVASFVPMPESEARYVRITPGGDGVLAEVGVVPVGATGTRTATLEEAARRAPAGRWPRSFAGEQMYWTVVGQDVDENEALMGEDGHVEIHRAGPSLEPFLYDLATGRDTRDRRLLGWADADATGQTLDAGDLPMPSVEHRWGPLHLRTSAFADDAPGAAGEDMTGRSGLYVTYDVTNDGPTFRRARLLVALRPFQVNPPFQFLGTSGGASEVRRLAASSEGFVADGVPVVSLAAPDAAGVAQFAQGGAEAWAVDGAVPPSASVDDPSGLASGVLAYDLALEPGATETVVLWTPLHEDADRPPTFATRAEAATFAESRRAVTAAGWQARLDAAAQLLLPPSQADLAGTVRTVLAYVLINRDGPRIQPGSRSYDRSWIRDGALTSSAMLRFGLPDVAADFARWYAPSQRSDGFVPCCVSRLGPDWTAEHDSHGQLAFLAAEVFRYTGDRAFLEEMWPHVERAAFAIDSLRAFRMTPAYRADTLRAYYGMMPESISHEGYSARAMHSYWDDLFVLRGMKDAAFVAHALGRPEAAALAARRDAFAADLRASYPLAMANRGIDYLPGSVELGDFDPTSVSVALDPVDAGDVLPAGALERTFERYWDFFVRRRDGDAWNDYTPYEWRNVGALVRLGHPARAHEAAAWFLSHRRPAAWHAFAEVVGREWRRPRFLGDIPHGWVGSDFLRAMSDLFAYEEGDRLVLGAGVPLAWLDEGAPVGVRGLRTHHGPLTYTARRDGADVVVEIEDGTVVPPGGLAVHAPFSSSARPTGATLGGRPVPLDGQTVVVRALPARLVFRY